MLCYKIVSFELCGFIVGNFRVRHFAVQGEARRQQGEARRQHFSWCAVLHAGSFLTFLLNLKKG